MARVRRSLPPPHGSEQGDQAAHAPSVQLTEHWTTQASVSASVVGQAAPLPSGSRKTMRVRVVAPLPHVRGSLGGRHAASGVLALHADQAEKGETTQSTSGMQVRMQLWSSRRPAHGAPPTVGCVTTTRVRVCEPVVT